MRTETNDSLLGWNSSGRSSIPREQPLSRSNLRPATERTSGRSLQPVLLEPETSKTAGVGFFSQTRLCTFGDGGCEPRHIRDHDTQPRQIEKPSQNNPGGSITESQALSQHKSKPRSNRTTGTSRTTTPKLPHKRRAKLHRSGPLRFHTKLFGSVIGFSRSTSVIGFLQLSYPQTQKPMRQELAAGIARRAAPDNGAAISAVRPAAICTRNQLSLVSSLFSLLDPGMYSRISHPRWQMASAQRKTKLAPVFVGKAHKPIRARQCA
ncbi:hypothetical protein M8818_005257 [Zalaria obscura]|uniref:Uncharacterized protein n=1 Tax=Zalaria obscura TaxID=2024903 RepID=A0ACC3SDN3_9PEZI